MIEPINITKLEEGFSYNGIKCQYDVDKTHHFENEDAVLILTNIGLVYFDLTTTIEGKSFDNIQDWITELYK